VASLRYSVIAVLTTPTPVQLVLFLRNICFNEAISERADDSSFVRKLRYLNLASAMQALALSHEQSLHGDKRICLLM